VAVLRFLKKVIDSKELLEEHTFDKEAMDLIVRSEALFLDIYASINNIGLASKRDSGEVQ
jgi:hypothetical protein